MRVLYFFIPFFLCLPFLVSGSPSALEESVLEAAKTHHAIVVFMNLKTDALIRSDALAAKKAFPPCSTFKIWNTLIGVESGWISSAQAPFYQWDGVSRFLPDWNKNLTLKEAFQVSCVPAFKILAKKIGPEKMRHWLALIGYGDQDISSGIDTFWLPAEEKKSILISPEEQVLLLSRLLKNQLPFSTRAQSILKEIMWVEQTDKGIWFGKTGSGSKINGITGNDLGWFVGYLENPKGIFVFACLLRKENASGKEAKEVIRQILTKTGLL